MSDEVRYNTIQLSMTTAKYFQFFLNRVTSQKFISILFNWSIYVVFV